MININLLGEKPDKRGIYSIQIASFIAVVCITMIVCFVVSDKFSTELEAKHGEKELLDARLAKLRVKTKQVEQLENKQKLLKEKLTTIAQIKANKQGPVRVLDDINKSLPERAWLDSINEKGGYVELKGVAIDNQTISQLMFDLEKSKYFDDVKLAFSEMIVKDEVKLKQFSLTAKLASLLNVKLPAGADENKDGADKKAEKAKPAREAKGKKKPAEPEA